ncbi:hypothetical protein [Campylobacter sp.]|uniref:hypothetical protein n=1 Tax=Campylobacter sp. TaxID=205 RepID=UPI002A854DBF|nr:hypothetical protein [Campylobacter sp.]MCI7237628.1 hypothetical protein [Campylobacter sp.]MDY4450587.1 hypothetical protein [Campylobacter sp.]
MFKTAKTKFLAFGAAVLGSASLANAAIAVNEADGKITGSIDLAPFMTGAGAVIVALGAMWVFKRVISLLR